MEEIRPGLCEVAVFRNGGEHARQVLAKNLIDLIMELIDEEPMLGRDVTRREALEQLGMVPK